MTRINVIPPEELYDQHLVAEYREIRLLTANLQRSLKSKKGVDRAKLPKKFTLGEGHCLFFYDKGLYLFWRYCEIAEEMLNRGMSPTLPFPMELWPPGLFYDWEPTEEAKNMVRERIALRVAQRPGWYRYYGVIV